MPPFIQVSSGATRTHLSYAQKCSWIGMGDTTVDRAFFIATVSYCGRSPAGRFPNRSYSATHFLFEHVHHLPLKNEAEQQMHFILQSGQIWSIQCNGFKRLMRMTELLTSVSLSDSFAVVPQAVSNPHMQHLAWVHPENPPCFEHFMFCWINWPCTMTKLTLCYGRW